jgi:CelD/BcsL family acetyltransferase involved in cellulose biosynthesis
MYKVELHTSIAAVRAEWEELVAAAGAAAFYRVPFLTAYEVAPMLPVTDRCYILVRDERGRLRAGLPVYLQSDIDPLGILSARYPLGDRPAGLLSHVWHCYDAGLVAPGADDRPDPELIAAVLEAMRGLARDAGAGWYGFVNLDAASPLVTALAAAGLRVAEIDERFRVDVAGLAGQEGYLARLSSHRRREVRRYGRRAKEAGVWARIADPRDADLDGLHAIVRRMAAKFDNSRFYPPGTFQTFMRELGPIARVVEIRMRDRLIAGGVCLQDDRRFHLWTGGVDYSAAKGFSPYNVMFFAMVRAALRSGRPVLEGGRRNAGFKGPHGLNRVPLVACLAPVTQPIEATVKEGGELST